MTKVLGNQRFLLFLKAVFILELILTALCARESGDDGSYLTAALFTSRGMVPLVDFSYCQGPGLPYLYAPFIRLLGPSLLATRLVGALFSLLVYWLSLKVATHFSAEGAATGQEEGYLVTSVQALLTILFILHPESWAILSRIDSKGSAAAFFALGAAAPLLVSRPGRQLGYVLSAASLGILVAIQYPYIIISAPLVLFVAANRPARETLIYCLLLAAGIFIVLGPYVVAHRFDYVWANFEAIVRLHKGNGLMEYARCATNYLRMCQRYQVAMLPAILFAFHDLRAEGGRKFVAAAVNLPLIIFLFMTALLIGAIHPSSLSRVHVFVPFLLIYSTLCVRRGVHALFSPSPRYALDPLRERIGWAVAVAFLMLVNINFMVPDTLADFEVTVPNFIALRWRLDHRFNGTTSELRALEAEDGTEPVLFIGAHQQWLTEAGLTPSVYSVGSTNFFNLDPFYGLAQAERYKFLTSGMFDTLLKQRRYSRIIIENWTFDKSEDPVFARIKAKLERVCQKTYTDKYISVYREPTPSSIPAS